MFTSPSTGYSAPWLLITQTTTIPMRPTVCKVPKARMTISATPQLSSRLRLPYGCRMYDCWIDFE